MFRKEMVCAFYLWGLGYKWINKFRRNRLTNKQNITMASQWAERHGVSSHQHIDCLLNRLLNITSKKNQSSASLPFVRGIHRWHVDPHYKGPVMGTMFPFDDVTFISLFSRYIITLPHGNILPFEIESIVTLELPYQTITNAEMCFCAISLGNLLGKHPSCWWFGTSRHDTLVTSWVTEYIV